MNLLLRGGEKIEGQLAPSAGSEVAEVERAEASAVARDLDTGNTIYERFSPASNVSRGDDASLIAVAVNARPSI